MALLYALTITFYVELGPHYARSGWLVMCAVMATLHYGVKGGVLATAFNGVILILLYWVIPPQHPAWAAVFNEPLKQWIMLIVNISLVTTLAALPVGVLLGWLDRSLKQKQESEERLRLALTSSKQSWFDLDIPTGVVAVSPEYVRMIGYDPVEFQSNIQGWIDGIHPEDRDGVLKVFRECLATGDTRSMEYCRRTKAGDWLWMNSIGKVIEWDSEHKPLRMIGTHADISERKKVEEALRESEKRYREMTDFLPISLFEVDSTGSLISFNPNALEAFRYKEEDFKEGMNALQFFAPDEWQKVGEKMGRVLQGTSIPGQEFTFIRKDGSTFSGLIYSSRIIDKNKVVGIRGAIIDITDRKRMEIALGDSEQRYRELSIVDDLTQLYNSRHFYSQLKIELDRSNRYGQPLTLLLLDIDNFKTFNDTYGHVEGDQVLMRLGQVVKRCLRETDFAYRYGGEEFTVVLPMTRSVDGAITAERIRAEFKKELFTPAPDQDVHVTVSIGLAQYNLQEEMKAFVHRVDQLMYQGKKNGKDRVCCEP